MKIKKQNVYDQNKDNFLDVIDLFEYFNSIDLILTFNSILDAFLD